MNKIVNKINRILSELFEKRTNPELNLKTNIIQDLERYKDNPEIYISFRTINKIGINPSSIYNETPNGIYTYPLKEIWNDIINDTLSFFSDPKKYPYIYVLKPKDNIKNFIKNVYENYTQDDLDKDIEKLRKIHKNNPFEFESDGWAIDSFDDFLTDAMVVSSITFRNVKYKKSPFVKFMNMTRLFAESMSQVGTSQQRWNNLLRTLGYSGFHDNGYGVISTYELHQAVFLSLNVLDTIEVILNKR